MRHICGVSGADFDSFRRGFPRLQPAVERPMELQLSDHFSGPSNVHSSVPVEMGNFSTSTGIGASMPVPRFHWDNAEDLD